jgi:RNA polymerase sigma factor (sigma-70 family)
MNGSTERRTDEELLRLSCRHPEAFGAFYRRHECALLVFFLRRTENAEAAADLTAEVFAAALASVGRFRPGPEPAIAWLYAIANHKLQSSRRRGRIEDRARRKLAMEPLVLTDEALEAVEALADSENASAVMAELLQHLPADQHDAIRKRIIEERDYGEIARELRCSPAVVRQRVSRGIRTIRSQLAKETS